MLQMARLDGKPSRAVTPLAAPTPTRTPIRPPTSAIVALSIRNCSSTSARLAPRALRTPISRVRSVTLTSMMFMITMPPTTSEMPAMATATSSNELEICDHSDIRLSLVSVVKLSSAPGWSCRRPRMISRTSSMARSMFGPAPAFTAMSIVFEVP